MTRVFDIETESWDRFVIGGLYDSETDCYESFDWEAETDMVDAILSAGGTWYAHNGGKFDALWLCGHLHERNIRAIVHMAGSRIIRLQVPEASLTIRDTFGIVPMSLAKASRMTGLEKVGLALDCRCGDDCGGYCAISRSMSRADFARLNEYLEIDCKALAALVDFVGAFADEHGLHLAGTIGQSAWKTAKAELDLPDCDWQMPAHFRMARSGYYGGRCQVFIPEAPLGHRYDLHSAYPAALEQTPIPVGQYAPAPRDVAARAYARGREGIFRASVYVPDCYVPPLPMRVEKNGHTTRIGYPTGNLTGVWSALELRHAESIGCRIDRFYWGLCWPRAETILAPFVRRIWELRAAADRDKNKALSGWLKLIANSLTGKLAQKPDVETHYVHPDESEIVHCTCETPARCRCKAWSPVSPDLSIWSRPGWRIVESSHCQWAAYLTAATRIEWHKQALHAGDALLYGDTDSVYATKKLIRRMGNDLGDWGYEGIARDWLALAPKAYRYYDDDGFHARLKGVPGLDRETFAAFARGDKIIFERGVKGFRSASRGKAMFSRRTLKRSNHADGIYYGDRIRRGDRTYPIRANDLRKLA